MENINSKQELTTTEMVKNFAPMMDEIEYDPITKEPLPPKTPEEKTTDLPLTEEQKPAEEQPTIQ